LSDSRLRVRLAALATLVTMAIAGCASPFASTRWGAPGQPTPIDSQPSTALPTPAAPTPTPTASPTNTPKPSPTPTQEPTPSPTPFPLEATLHIDSPRIAQGKTGLLRVNTNRSARVTGTLQETELRFSSPDSLTHLALYGVGAMAEVGPWRLEVTVQGTDGALVRLRTSVDIVPGEFHTEVLQFEPEVEQLLDPEITWPEHLRLKEVFSGYTDVRRWQGVWRWPLETIYVTSPFGSRRQYGDRPPGSCHAGLDLRGAVGVPVCAAAPGTVALADALQVRGNAVILDHGLGVFSGYFHLDSIEVEPGQEVLAGDLIGTVGATGLVTGSHLHWEVRVGGVAVDPAEWTERAFDGSQPEPMGADTD